MSPAELAARRYIEIWSEPDRAARAALLEQCFAPDGRLVGRGKTIHGRANLAATIEALLADPRGFHVRVISVVDAAREMFRFRSVFGVGDGSPDVEAYDVGEVDDEGRIVVLYAWTGPLLDA